MMYCLYSTCYYYYYFIKRASFLNTSRPRCHGAVCFVDNHIAINLNLNSFSDTKGSTDAASIFDKRSARPFEEGNFAVTMKFAQFPLDYVPCIIGTCIMGHYLVVMKV